MDEPSKQYLECLARLREDPLNPDALFTLAVLYAEEGHRTSALHYLRKVEYLDGAYPGLRRLKNHLQNWPGSNGVPPSPPANRRAK